MWITPFLNKFLLPFMAKQPELEVGISNEEGIKSFNSNKVYTLFPTFNSIEELWAYTQAKIPKEYINDVHALLMSYSNTINKIGNK